MASARGAPVEEHSGGDSSSRLPRRGPSSRRIRRTGSPAADEGAAARRGPTLGEQQRRRGVGRCRGSNGGGPLRAADPPAQPYRPPIPSPPFPCSSSPRSPRQRRQRQTGKGKGGKKRKAPSAGKKGRPAAAQGQEPAKKGKRPQSAFFLFMKDFREEYKVTHPDEKGAAAVGKAGGEKWRSMTDEEKKPYFDQAEELKAQLRDNDNADGSADNNAVLHHTRSLTALKDVGLICFRDLIFQEIKGQVEDAVIALIDQEREGYYRLLLCQSSKLDC